MASSLQVVPFPPQGPWAAADPFLFCVHHVDAYPTGNGAFGPSTPLAGRNLGQDFANRDGWNMYHGSAIPGFPPHPHRGFETVTVMRSGFVDHSDSLGAQARFGAGDVQWMTAGRGIVHSEMFPLLSRERPNPLELFQIWVNLPPEDKMVEPHFTMLWSEAVPRARVADAEGREAEIVVVAGSWGDRRPPAPPPRSWASRAGSGFALWTIRLPAGGSLRLPAVPEGVLRTLQVFGGAGVTATPAGEEARGVGNRHTVLVSNPGEVVLTAMARAAEVLLLQARPIGAPVASHGPFVMNTRDQLVAAYDDYRRTRFGGWPWPTQEPVHGPEPRRFARLPDGAVVHP